MDQSRHGGHLTVERAPHDRFEQSVTYLGIRGRARGRSRRGKELGAESEQGLVSSGFPPLPPLRGGLSRGTCGSEQHGSPGSQQAMRTRKWGVGGNKGVGSDAW